MMKIAFEAQRIFRANKHGMDFVALECIREIQKIDHENEYFVFVSPGPDRCLQESENVHIIELKCPTYPLWEQIALPMAVKRVKADILHCTSNTAPIFSPIPFVVTLHDVIFLENRNHSSLSLYQNLGWYYRRLVVPKILNKCKKFITVSDFERERIIQTVHLPQEMVQTVYNGVNKQFMVKEKNRETVRKYMQNDDFLFYLGNTDPKKNAVGLLKAYSLYLAKSAKKRPLLIADLKEDYLDSILQSQHIEHIKPYIVIPGYINNKDLVDIYNSAYLFLYPSLRESFGIPMLEAMACGTPVVASNTSAMPEIVGDGALLIDPNKPEEIADVIIKLENDSAFYDHQVAYGLERCKMFTWEQTALNTLKVYLQVFNALCG